MLFQNHRYFSTYISNNVSCFGGNDGSIDLTITGGVGNYTTIWNSPNGYFNISEDVLVIAGPYTYSILDDNGCSPSINNSPIFISQPINVQISSVVTDETYGDLDGSIDMTISGPSTYTYSWVGPNSFSSTNLDITNLTGSYNLIITDANNCQTQITENVNIGNIILIDTFINHISCNGFNDGSIVVLAQNSLKHNIFLDRTQWIYFSSNSQIFNLTGGVYSVIVNDISNCPTQLNVSILNQIFYH